LNRYFPDGVRWRIPYLSRVAVELFPDLAVIEHKKPLASPGPGELQHGCLDFGDFLSRSRLGSRLAEILGPSDRFGRSREPEPVHPTLFGWFFRRHKRTLGPRYGGVKALEPVVGVRDIDALHHFRERVACRVGVGRPNQHGKQDEQQDSHWNSRDSSG